MTDDSNDADKSAYNSAVQFMFELSGIRKKLHEARWESDVELRYDVLVSYYMALSARMNGKFSGLQDKHDKEYQETTLALGEYLKAKQRKKRISMKIYIKLDSWEHLLRKDENALGLLVPDKSDPAFALGGQNF